MNELVMSPLGHTWLIDLDGCVLSHNGHLSGKDRVLESARDFLATLPATDKIILLSARDESFRKTTSAFLTREGIRFDLMIFGLPHGERILINDKKPSGLDTAIAINLIRDLGPAGLRLRTDERL